MKAIPLARVRFNNQAQEGPGLSSSSMTSCWDPTNGKNSRHKIWFHQWVCGGSYWVEFFDRNPLDDKAEMQACGYIVPNRGDVMVTVDGPIPAPSRGPGRPPKGA